MRIVLDTSAYAHMRAQHAEALDLVAGAEVVCLPTVVLGELEAAFQLGRRTRENVVALEEFLAEPFTAVLPVTLDVARRYGRLFAALRRAGTPLPINDVWIAATTLEAGAHLVTFDEDFVRVPGLEATVLRS